MANPQTEDGHIRIANEVWDILAMVRLTKYQRDAIDLVLRMSYGCGQRSCQVTEWQDFAFCAGIHRSKIREVLESLVEVGVFNIRWDQRIIYFVKDWQRWDIELIQGFEPARYANLLRHNLAHKIEIAVLTSKLTDLSKSEAALTSEVTENQVQLSKSEAALTSEVSGEAVDNDEDKAEGTPKNKERHIYKNNKKQTVFFDGKFIDKTDQEDYWELTESYRIAKRSAQRIVEQLSSTEIRKQCDRYMEWQAKQKVKGLEQDIPGALINHFAELGVIGIKKEGG